MPSIPVPVAFTPREIACASGSPLDRVLAGLTGEVVLDIVVLRDGASRWMSWWKWL